MLDNEEVLPKALLKLVDLDRLVHEPARHLLMAILYVVREADFLFLHHQTGLSGGNISSHMNKLEQADYVEIRKTFNDRRPQTIFALTDRGRLAFETYREAMGAILNGSGENPS